ncbi:MAG: orotate phosphoribosyltransferase [Acidimicrobiales bacterium]
MDAPARKSHGAAQPAGSLRDSLRDLVLERGYERREAAFVLSSGGRSHDYVDMRRAVSRGEDLELAARAVAEALQTAGIEFDVIGGMTMGADPVAHAVAMLASKAWFSVRKAAKDHGTGRRTEGAALSPGVRAVVFEDTVSTGRSLLEALEVVHHSPATVVAACTMLDRGDRLSASLGKKEHLGPFGDPVVLVRVLTYLDLGLEPL